MRGVRVVALHRLTPACAGSTPGPDQIGTISPTDPRVCGEHHSGMASPAPTSSTDPRVCGEHHSLTPECGKGILTPACAGSTPRGRAGVGAGPTDPRVCGEHVASATPTIAACD